VIVALSALAIVRALVMWSSSRAQFSPDFGIYTSGTIGFYPSPLGTTLGAVLGQQGMVGLSALAAGVLVYVVGIASGSAWMALIAFAMPIGWLTGFAGVDAIAAALFVLAGTGLLGTGRWRWLAHGAGVGVHLALLPFVLVLERRRLHPVVWLVAAVGAVGALAATPYAGILTPDAPAAIAWAAIATLALVAVQLLPALLSIVDSLNVKASGLLLAIGPLEAAAQGHRYVRYSLPAFFLILARYTTKGPQNAS